MEKIGLEIHLLVDGSGSMRRVEDQTKNAANLYIRNLTLASMPATVTVVNFRGGTLTTLIDRRPAYDLPQLHKLPMGGGTPLCDAIGGAIKKLATSQAKQKAIIVLTDGMEEGSQTYNRETIRKMVQESRANGWLFIFIGIGQRDGYDPPTSHAPQLGIPMEQTVDCKPETITECMEIAAMATLRFQGSGDTTAAVFTDEERKIVA